MLCLHWSSLSVNPKVILQVLLSLVVKILACQTSKLQQAFIDAVGLYLLSNAANMA